MCSEGDNSRPDENGGRGAIIESLKDGSRRRSDLRLVDRGLREGWITPFNMSKRHADLPDVVMDAVNEAKEEGERRSVFTGAAVLTRMMEVNLNIAATIDKIRGDAEPEEQNIRIEYERVLPKGEE